MLSIGAETWKFRALIDALVRRHVATRYRGSLFGFLWSFLNPLCLMAVYTLVFHYYMRFNGGEHYHLMVFAGLLPWIWTSSALGEGTSSIVGSGHLITKSMFPAHVLPCVSVLSTMMHFVLALPILALFMVFAGVPITAMWLLLPLLLLIHACILDGLALALGALNVFFRDVQHIVGNLLTFIFFLCPVVYPESAVPERFRFLLEWNPFALLTVCYQRVLVQGIMPASGAIGFLALSAVVSLMIGLWVYGRFSERFAEAL